MIEDALESLWRRYAQIGPTGVPPEDWAADNVTIGRLHLGLFETMQYLYTRPTLEEFEAWIAERKNEATCAAATPTAAEDVLSAADLAFWDENGYLVVHEAVSREQARAAVAAICEFLQIDETNPNTWYGGPQGHSIWIPLLRHPAIEANRTAPRVRRAFEQIWGRADLWMNTDQCGMNPPERPGWQFPGPHLHWDTSLEQPIPFGVQGILYLADVEPEQGAFTCVPGFHKRIEAWLDNLPNEMDPRAQDLEALGPKPIPGSAGDLIVWHHALPHGSRPNRAERPRFVQYMTMRPEQWDYRTKWR